MDEGLALVPQEVVLKKSNELLQNYPLLAGSRDVVDLYSEVLEDLREEFGNSTIAQYETQIILQVREWSGKKRNLLQMASHSTGAPNAEQQQPEKRMRNENNSSVVQEQQERQNPTAAAANTSSSLPGSINVNLGEGKYAQTQWYNGKKLLNIRKWYTDKTSGELKPTKQGIVLNPDQWSCLASKSDQITTAFDEDGDHELDTPCEIGGNKKLSVQPYNNKPLLHIREYYEDQGGEWKPTRKGVTLKYTEWLMLLKNIAEISRIMKIETEAGDERTAVATTATTSAATREVKPETAQQQQPSASASGGGGVSATATTGVEEVHLSEKRILKVRSWKSSKLADFREYYQGKGDQGLLPGKKGVSLNVRQWSCMFEHLQQVEDALQSSNTQYLLRLDNSAKRVTISNYKGGLYVDIREWYDSGADEWKPGRKGISLSKEQWSKVFLNASAVHLAMTTN